MLSLVDVKTDSNGSWSTDVLRVMGESQGHSEAVKESSNSDTSSEHTSPPPDQGRQIHLQATLNCLIGIGNNKFTQTGNKGEASEDEDEDGREKTKARKLANRKWTMRRRDKLSPNIFEGFRREDNETGSGEVIGEMEVGSERHEELAKVEKNDAGESLEEDEGQNEEVNGRRKSKNQGLYPHGHCSIM